MAKKKKQSAEEITDQNIGEVAKWVQEIKLYEQEANPWIERAKKIVRRYKDERGPRELKKRYNILWSNTQTLQPAIFDRPPNPNISPRFKDDDALSRVSADVLERCASYFVKEDIFQQVMDEVVLDRLLSGRGTAWVRYVPNFKDKTIQGSEEEQGEGVQLTDDVYSEQTLGDGMDELYSEEVAFDYVHWQDFGHTWARTWEEVRAGWKKVFLDRSELKERFGDEIGSQIPLDYFPEKLNEEKVEDTMKKATIYEIWDKPSRKVIWIHKDYQQPLDIKDDPLKLRGFFPFPKPLFATLANDSIIPVPDYTEYQDQALELDELTARISALTKAVKAAGIYDASAEGIQRVLAEGVENTLIPIENYVGMAEKGGLAGAISFLPMQEILKTLLGLYEARDKVKQDLYEITGISDIIRGASNANETATAQQIKGQYANLRLGRMQRKAESFARDLVRISTEIISEHFSLETIKNISGVILLTQAEKQIAQLIQQGQPIQPTPTIANAMKDPDKMQELMGNPTWEEVYELIRNDSMRCFRIDIETDSTIKIDQDNEKQSRTELLTAIVPMVEQIGMASPEAKPILMELLSFGIRGYKAGKDLEGMIDVVKQKMQKQAQQPQQTPPDPEIIKAQQQAQIESQRIQIEAKKAQDQSDLEKMKIQLEHQNKNRELDLKQEQMLKDYEAKMLELQEKAQDRALKGQEVAHKAQEFYTKMGIDLEKHVTEKTKAENEAKAPEINESLQNLAQALQDGLAQIAQITHESNSRVLDAVSKRKKLKVVRDPKTNKMMQIDEE